MRSSKIWSGLLLIPLFLTVCTVDQPLSPPADGADVVRVARVVDGDTVELADARRLRYIGVNTPERDQPFYQEATELNRELVEGRPVRLEFDVSLTDQYGRLLAYVWVEDTMINLELVRRGFASVFTVPPNVKYEADFRAAEREAREAGRGLWQASDIPLEITALNADSPGSDNQNPNGEWVEITNWGNQAIAMQGFTLKDAASNLYLFGNFVLGPRSSVRVFSGRGTDGPAALYWGLEGQSVWNNNGDTAFLRDANGVFVAVYSY
jgi:micrococcal nuclease